MSSRHTHESTRLLDRCPDVRPTIRQRRQAGALPELARKTARIHKAAALGNLRRGQSRFLQQARRAEHAGLDQELLRGRAERGMETPLELAE